jgi:glycerophosphoryl diester phosphodiesterase
MVKIQTNGWDLSKTTRLPFRAILVAFFLLVGVLGAQPEAGAETAKQEVPPGQETTSKVRPDRGSGYRPDVAAHRGSCGFLPEHTLEGMAFAYAAGADYIEQDVVMTRDGVLVVLHDHTLETTTDVAKVFPGRHRPDGSYYAIDFSFAEIRSLRVTERFKPATGQAVFPGRFPVDSEIDFRVPTLREALELIQGLNQSTGQYRMPYVEVKEPAFFEREGKPIMQATIDMLTEYGWNSLESGAILQCFDYEATKGARAQGWKGELCMLVNLDGQRLTDDRSRQKWMLSPEGIREVSRFATIYAPWFSLMAEPREDGRGYRINDLCQQARKNGMKVHSWTHRRDAPLKGFTDSRQVLDAAFKELKLDGLFSDFPGDVVDYLRQEGLRQPSGQTPDFP